MTTLIIRAFARLSTAPAINVCLAAAARSVADGARLSLRQFLTSLHESRRQQAALTIARYRHLIFDTDTATHFKTTTNNPE
jgi:plasmid stability protein